MALTAGAEYAPEIDAEFELVHADSLRFFSQLVADLGGDLDALLRHVGIDPSLLSKRGSSLGYRAMANLLERAATELQCADFGMRLASLQGGGKVFGPMGVVMRNSNTLGEALDYDSSTSVLSRSCHRWFSASPRQLRGGACAARGGMVQ